MTGQQDTKEKTEFLDLELFSISFIFTQIKWNSCRVHGLRVTENYNNHFNATIHAVCIRYKNLDFQGLYSSRNVCPYILGH